MKAIPGSQAQRPADKVNIGTKIAQPIQNANFRKIFPFALVLLGALLLFFMPPWKLDSSDFRLIAWFPGRELLSTGSISPEYPYPLWTVMVLIPLVLLPSHIAEVIWFFCNLVMLSASIALLISFCAWDLSLLRLSLIVLLSGLFLPVLTSAFIGQLTIFSLFMLALSIHFYKHSRFTWLGIILGLSLIKPQVSILFTGLLLLWALRQRHWRTLIGFTAVILSLTLISLPFTTSPAQIIGGGISGHISTYVLETSTLWGLLLNLGLPWIVPAMAAIGLMGWLGWIWIPFLLAKVQSWNTFLFLSSSAILVNLLVLPYSWMHNLALCLLSFIYCFSLILKMHGRPRVYWMAAIVLVMHPLMLICFLLFAGSKYGQSIEVVPAVMLLAMMIALQFVNRPTLNAQSLPVV